jgi:hypothetical protein
MEQTILTKSQRTALEIITGTTLVKTFYLAGGTALAMHLKHRYSDDFDFFSQKTFQPKSVITLLKDQGKIKVIFEDHDTLHLLVNKINVSFFHYGNRLLTSLIKKENNLQLASIPDIAAMKIAAICSRGSKKDFVDLYVISTKCFPLQQAIEYFNKKIKPVRYDQYHVVRSLQYFEDAEKQEMPKMIMRVSWSEVKKFFEKEVKELNK